MLELHIRPKLQPIFNILGSVGYRLSPNSCTALALICGIGAGVALGLQYAHTGICLLWLSGLFDVLDGTIARLQRSSSAIGAYYDLISDRIVETAIIFGLAYAFPQDMWAYLIFMAALLLHYATFITAGALFKNSGSKSMHHDHSIVERAEAFVVFSLLVLLPEYRFYILMSFNFVIIFDALRRLFRVSRFNASL